MMRFLRKGNGYAFSRPIQECSYLDIKAGGKLLAIVLIFCFQFVCLAQEQSAETQAVTEGHIGKMHHRQALVEKVDSDPRFDTKRYPMLVYEINEESLIQTRIGDSISDEIMNMPLWIVGKDTMSDTLKLSDIPRGKLIIIDFWTTWCAPCVESMDEWERIVDELGDDIVLLGAHMSFDYYAHPFISQRNWQSKSIIGLNAWVLNRCFFEPMTISRSVWIKDNRLVAITGTRPISVEKIKDVINGEEVELPVVYESSYSFKQS